MLTTGSMDGKGIGCKQRNMNVARKYGPMYSYSKINSYFNCPLMFKYRYIERVKVERFEGIEAFLGKRVHETLEMLYSDLKRQKVNSASDLRTYYEDRWEKKYSDDVRIVKKGYCSENYLGMGRKYIADYYKKNFPFTSSTTVSLEQKVNLKLDGHSIVGYIDRLAICGQDSAYEIHDYKTSGSLPPQAVLKRDEQLSLYALAVRNMYDDAKNIRVVWHYLAFNKEFGYLRSEKELEDVAKSLIRKIGIIEDAVKEGDFLPNASALCSWCEYQEICPIHKHKFSACNDTKKVYESGVELVDRYALLKMRQRKIADEMDEVRDALIEYCIKNGMSAVESVEYVAKVSESKDVKYPRAGDENRKELEDYLRKAKLWDKVAGLDVFALRRVLKETLLDKRVADRIRGFGSEEISYKVSLGKRKEGE